MKLGLAAVGGVLLIAAAVAALITLRPKPIPPLHFVAPVTSPATATPAAGPLPQFQAGSYTGIKPAVIGFSADGGNIIGHIHWLSWTATKAVGIGTRTLQNCIPNCAQGKNTLVPEKLVLSNPEGGLFTTIVASYAGTTDEYQSGGLWALDASNAN